jgi:uncharacterized membrane protein YjgN (DUF898 family)
MMLNTPQNTPLDPSDPSDAAASPAHTLSAAEIDAQIEARLAQLRGVSSDVNGGSAAAAPALSATSFEPVKHTLAFSGSGSEYFRIWIVNLLLTIVTLTLYSPWAKVRKLQYFYRNTTLDAQPFDYHANPWALFKGRLVALALLGAYTLAGYVGTTATLAFGALVIAVGPWLIWRSLGFRLANTSYRAVRFGFKGTLKGAYWVFGIATFVAVAYLIGIALLAESMAESAGKGEMPDTAGYMGLFALVPFLFPLWQWAMKNYQHSNYEWASVTSHFSATKGSFYKAWIKYFLVVLGLGFVFFIVFMIFSFVSIGGVIGIGEIFKIKNMSKLLGMAAFFVMIGLGYILFIALMQAYLASRFQNLVWNNTQGETVANANTAVQFHSDLKLWPLCKVMTVNVVLTIFTLGLYWPFAAIRLAKTRLESVSVTQYQPWSNIAPSLASGNADGALGSEVQDVFDVDFAL